MRTILSVIVVPPVPAPGVAATRATVDYPRALAAGRMNLSVGRKDVAREAARHK
jgi:hypothetical protein